MTSISLETLAAAPLLLDAFRNSQEEFGIAAASYAKVPRLPAMGAYNEECLELLDHLISVMGDSRGQLSQGAEDACIFLLEHLAVQVREQSQHVAGAAIQ